MASNQFSREKVGLLVVRTALAVFFIFEGWDKLPWMTNPGLLADILHRWAGSGAPTGKWYVETVLLPWVSIFARLTFLGEVAAGLALLFGFWPRAVAVLTFLLVVNIHVAHSTLFNYGFLSKGDGLPILAGLLALALVGAELPLSLSSKRK